VAVRWRRFNLGLELGEFQGGAFGPGVNEGAIFGGQGEALFGAHGAFRAGLPRVPGGGGGGTTAGGGAVVATSA